MQVSTSTVQMYEIKLKYVLWLNIVNGQELFPLKVGIRRSMKNQFPVCDLATTGHSGRTITVSQ